jgi:hypothetical protein
MERKENLEVVHHAFDSILQMCHIEVNQESESLAAKPEVREQLRFMYREQPFYRFQFYDHRAVHHHVDPVAKIKLDPFINEWQGA